MRDEDVQRMIENLEETLIKQKVENALAGEKAYGEFLARGGQIQTSSKQSTQPVRVLNDYSNKEFEEKLHNFYQCKEWKQLREVVKKEYTPMCPVCGSEDNLVVDHIKPVRYFWEERLNKNNERCK